MLQPFVIHTPSASDRLASQGMIPMHTRGPCHSDNRELWF